MISTRARTNKTKQSTKLFVLKRYQHNKKWYQWSRSLFLRRDEKRQNTEQHMEFKKKQQHHIPQSLFKNE